MQMNVVSGHIQRADATDVDELLMIAQSLAECHDFAALPAFERAIDACAQDDEPLRMLNALAARVETQIRSRRTHADISNWIDLLIEQSQNVDLHINHDKDKLSYLPFYIGRLAAYLYFKASDSTLSAQAQHALDLVTHVASGLSSREDATLHVNAREIDWALAACTYLSAYAHLSEKNELRVIVERCGERLRTAADASPLRVGEWLTERALMRTFHARADSTQLEILRQEFAQSEDWVSTHGLDSLRFKCERLRVEILAMEGKLDEAIACLDQASSLIGIDHDIDWLQYFYKRADVSLQRFDGHATLSAADSALRLCEQTGIPSERRAIYASFRAAALAKLGRTDDAIAQYESIIATIAEGYRSFYESTRDSLSAFRDWDHDRLIAQSQLRAAMSCQAARRNERFLWSTPEIASKSYARALEMDCEPAFALRAIAAQSLQPPPFAMASWPWPLRIRLFGRMSIERNGEMIALDGKAQRKPLALLAYVAMAPHAEYSIESILARLFPSSEYDDPKNAFDVALFRLRKLLGVDGVLRLSSGVLSLDRSRVWVDLTLFDKLVDDVVAEERRDETSTATLYKIRDSLELAAGDLLADEPHDFAKAKRNQVHRRVDQIVEIAATFEERQGRAEAAIDWWEQSLSRSPINEIAYRGLMRAHQRLGNNAQALLIFRKCAEVTSSMLGIAPSQATEALRREILDASLPRIATSNVRLVA
jgi:DNA-binding SARP family transcriptional activator